MIAEIVPPAANLATKLDLQLELARIKLAIAEMDGSLRAQMAEMDGSLRAQMAEMDGRLRTEIRDSSQQTLRWMFGFFVPVWLGSWGTVVAVLLKS